mmetsp:Transcript_27437/g.59930  ORF Transcript_27437/g.59930 Transcript_27437/m.59930 type:complete len:213 (+) Transcript_27437:764-1402(+)
MPVIKHVYVLDIYKSSGRATLLHRFNNLITRVVPLVEVTIKMLPSLLLPDNVAKEAQGGHPPNLHVKQRRLHAPQSLEAAGVGADHLEGTLLVLALRLAEAAVRLQVCAVGGVQLAELSHHLLGDGHVSGRGVALHGGQQLVHHDAPARHPLLVELVEEALGLGGGHDGGDGGDDELGLGRVAEEVAHLRHAPLQRLQLHHRLVLVHILRPK